MRLGLFLAAALGASAPAAANDTTASTGAGGLVLERTDAIDMASEDLLVSADLIRVRYVFRNQTADDVETIVAFPMPLRDLSEEWGRNHSYPSDFHTAVEGRPVQSALERKAIVKGQDHTALLERLRIPVAPGNIMDATKVMDALPEAERSRLQSLGLAGVEEFSFGAEPMAHHLVPLWTVQDRYWWRQSFPAGRDLNVEHRYVPGAGSSVDTLLASEYVKPDDPDLLALIERYCIGKDFLAAAERLRKPNVVLPPRWIDYILTTGANWRSPIGSFRLVVDKGKPGNLVSFCGTGVKQISPTQFEVRHENWRPTRDLHVLILEPIEQAR